MKINEQDFLDSLKMKVVSGFCADERENSGKPSSTTAVLGDHLPGREPRSWLQARVHDPADGLLGGGSSYFCLLDLSSHTASRSRATGAPALMKGSGGWGLRHSRLTSADDGQDLQMSVENGGGLQMPVEQQTGPSTNERTRTGQSSGHDQSSWVQRR